MNSLNDELAGRVTITLDDNGDWKATHYHSNGAGGSLAFTDTDPLKAMMALAQALGTMSDEIGDLWSEECARSGKFEDAIRAHRADTHSSLWVDRELWHALPEADEGEDTRRDLPA